MKMFLALLVLVAAAMAAPQGDPKDAVILKSSFENIGTPDGYAFDFDTSDGTSRKESGILKNVGTEQEALSVTGEISWIAADGQKYTMTYVADENGFQPQGAHLV